MSRTGYPLFQTGAEAAAILDKAAAAPTHDDLDALREEMGSSSSILQSVYPVGAIYISTVSTNPSTLFGFGTWEQIQNRFLLAAGSTYAAGATGGAATHKLTVNEMPSHTHNIMSGYGDTGTNTIDSYRYQFWGGNNYGSKSGALGAQATGGGAAHNNMPPYLAVYMWRRVS